MPNSRFISSFDSDTRGSASRFIVLLAIPGRGIQLDHASYSRFVDRVECLYQVLDLLHIPHPSHEKDYLLKRDAELAFYLLLWLRHPRKRFKVYSVIGNEHL